MIDRGNLSMDVLMLLKKAGNYLHLRVINCFFLVQLAVRHFSSIWVFSSIGI